MYIYIYIYIKVAVEFEALQNDLRAMEGDGAEMKLANRLPNKC
jgi:hypothetical protein